MTAGEKKALCDALIDEGVLLGTVRKPTFLPRHGTCCTCQECGHPHDECVCQHNRLIDVIDALMEHDTAPVQACESLMKYGRCGA